MESHAIESENLAAHVSLCHERYQNLERKFDEVENKIDEINRRLVDIGRDLHKIATDQANRWNTAQIGLISVLVGVIGALVSKLWF